MISLSTVQEAFVTTLKADPTITVTLYDAHEIREDQWQGKDFTYPCIRVDVQSANPLTGANCADGEIFDIELLIYSEQPSSKQCNDICALVVNKYHNKSFSSGALRFAGMVCTVLTAARRIDQQTWMSKVHLKGSVS